MCQILRPLAHLDEMHYVAQCEHGTVTLFWYATGWYFDSLEYERFAGFLETAAQSELESVREGSLVLVRHDGRIRVWYGEAGLNLNQTDFERFCRLIGQSVFQMMPSGLNAPSRRLRRDEREKQILGVLN